MKKDELLALGAGEEVAEKISEVFEAELNARLSVEVNAKVEAEVNERVNAIKLENAVDLAVKTSGAKNAKAVKALLDLKDARLLENGTVEGLEERLNQLKTSPDSDFLFEVNGGVRFAGAVSGETGREVPDKRVDFSKMSYSELCAFLEGNPKVKI